MKATWLNFLLILAAAIGGMAMLWLAEYVCRG